MVSGVTNCFDLAYPCGWLGCGGLELCVERDPEDSFVLGGHGGCMCLPKPTMREARVLVVPVSCQRGRTWRCYEKNQA
jgi:hypothetical protein